MEINLFGRSFFGELIGVHSSETYVQADIGAVGFQAISRSAIQAVYKAIRIATAASDGLNWGTDFSENATVNDAILDKICGI